ncbi:hypothetical protein DICSQDRAFT_128421 [Dichomitus squalens LYAD-421 SS1]|uniref:DUF6533 domain-containing protein n=1 Tax=Dichomitus squalens (strain LYAD-421) TaxID=732165 RepID=R7ST88_DICSQ|nr:uncharacterized protein DICSQDRAFT_128421 [Dichomitus squalens LYAD-421 SS1]EJF59266.1 hypothetical protein DICSQDRAFT_128421 [Dichomitus squalens LYAD-421 SS1]
MSPYYLDLSTPNIQFIQAFTSWMPAVRYPDSEHSGFTSAQSEFIVRICASVSLGDAKGLPLVAILYYDYALTIVAEVERFWMRRWSLVSLIFFLNRYLSLLGHIPVAYELFGVYDASQALIAAIQIIIGVLQLFRTYALYNRNRRMLFFLFAYGLVAASIAIWVVTKAFGISKADPQDAVSTSGCEGFLLEAEGRFLAGAWSISLAFDAVIFMLTLYKTLDAVFRSATRSSLSTLLLRDVAKFMFDSETQP